MEFSPRAAELTTLLESRITNFYQRQMHSRATSESETLRWQPVFWIGSAILAAFLALAGAAWFLELTYLLYFNLFGALYGLLIYLSLYIEIRWRVYERTTLAINNTWLFQKMKSAFTLDRQAIIFFLQIGYLLTSFGLFVWAYKLMFVKVEKGNLVNPLQVIAQLAGFLFWRCSVRVRYLLLLSFFFSLCCSLHFQGIDREVLSFTLLLFLIVIFLIPLDYAYFIVFLGYFLDQGLAKWGFYLAFQQAGYHALSFVFERGQSSATSKKRILSFLFLLLIQAFFGLIYFGDLYFAEPLRLAALLSGACIILISSAKLTMWPFILTSGFNLILSLFIGIMSSPGDKTTTIWGIPHGIIIFVLFHIGAFFGFFLFRESIPGRKQPLVPFFFASLFLLLGSFPELAWLKKWIEGIDLLLLFLGLFSFIEGKGVESKTSENLGLGNGANKVKANISPKER
ncbi:uncharacterized protein LOC116190023 [Punica granatum]|uniref:Uncharacterized protein LOC116190023 n=1 Tax=Punica granatum TaxID=22663 RepID=A0A6P8C1B6_PUNGR|nr:uncharacterized protein LOC116190023 [Punica granatum]